MKAASSLQYAVELPVLSPPLNMVSNTFQFNTALPYLFIINNFPSPITYDALKEIINYHHQSPTQHSRNFELLPKPASRD